MKPEPSLTVLSLGGEVQSSVMALVASEGAFDHIPGGHLDSLQQIASNCTKVVHRAASNDELARKRRMISYPDGVTPDPLELLTKLDSLVKSHD